MQTHQVAMLEDICRLGVFLTLDDFGSRTTPLSILSAEHVKKVKIHGPRVREALEDRRGMEMLRAIIASVQQFEIQVVAEGVETEEQLDLLKSLGCDAYLGRICQGPLPDSEVASFLEQRAS